VAGAVFWALVALATLTSLATAWALGANSNSPPFAPAIGANAISTMRAAFLIGILAALGALTQGGAISETVGAGLIRRQITSLAATAGLLTATGFMAFGVYTGYPVPAAFATTGAMVGVGLSLGGDPAIDTYRRIALFWALVPPFRAGSPISLPLSSDATTSRRRSASRCLRQSSAVSSPTSNWALSPRRPRRAKVPSQSSLRDRSSCRRSPMSIP